MAIKLFPNKSTGRPSVSVKVDTNNLVGSASDTAKQLMLIGMANGGEPNKVYKITTYADAKAIFRGGDLLDAIEVALSPNATTSSGTILAERVGSATQATYENNGLKITSKTFSSDANNIQTSLAKNTLNDTYNLTVTFDIDNYNHIYTNLGKIMGIYYSGTQQYAEVTVKTDSDTDGEQHTGQAVKLVLKAGAEKGSATVVKEFPLGQGRYNKVNALIGGVNEIDGFNAVYFAYGNKNIETKYLDAIDGQELSKSAENPTYLTSLGGDIVNALHDEDDEAISAEYDTSKGEPTAYDITSLTGGSSSEIPPASWAKEIRNFATVPGYYLVPLTADTTIQAEALAFCADRIKEADPRQVIVGGGFGDSINSSIQRANLLRSRDVRVWVNPISGTRIMNNGVTQHLPGYIVAAQVGGLATGLDLGESITFKQLDLVDIDQKYTKDQLDILDANGVGGIEFVRNRNGQVFRITNDITTARPISQDPGETELGTGEEVDFIVTSLRTELEDKYIGTSTSLSAAADIKTSVISFLQQQQNEGVVVDYSESDIHVAIVGERVNIQISCVIARAIKNVNVNLIFVDEQLNA